MDQNVRNEYFLGFAQNFTGCQSVCNEQYLMLY